MIQQSLNVTTLEGLVKLTRNVVIVTLGIELLFGAILALRFSAEMPLDQALYYGIYHSISAFCNAGFDLFGNFNSLATYAGDPVVNLSIMILVVIGGLGFVVLVDLARYAYKRDRLSLHSKLVLITTAALLVISTIGVYAIEHGNAKTIGQLSSGEQVLASMFASTAARSSGYSSIDYAEMTQGGHLFTIGLMFIGASPGSTGGGIKTVTAVVILMYIWTMISNKESTVVFKRTVSRRVIYKALVISVMTGMLILFATFFLTVTEENDFLRLLFEATSAVCTVGLSTNLTPMLSDAAHILLIVMMFIGRLGPLTIALALAARKPDRANLKYPEENLYIG